MQEGNGGLPVGLQIVLLYGTIYIIFMCAVWWPIKGHWIYPGELNPAKLPLEFGTG